MTDRIIFEFKSATVVIWPELERLAIVSPFGDASMSFEECLTEIEKSRKNGGRRGARSVDKAH